MPDIDVFVLVCKHRIFRFIKGTERVSDLRRRDHEMNFNAQKSMSKQSNSISKKATTTTTNMYQTLHMHKNMYDREDDTKTEHNLQRSSWQWMEISICVSCRATHCTVIFRICRDAMNIAELIVHSMHIYSRWKWERALLTNCMCVLMIYGLGLARCDRRIKWTRWLF